jgi:MFS transporter, DHA2 family, multidrug resistance protein
MTTALPADEALASDLRFRPNYAGIAALSLGTSAMVMDGGITAVTLPGIAGQLNVADSTVVLLISIYQLVLLAAILPFSRLSETIGYRRIYTGGQIVFLLASVGILLIDSFVMLIIMRSVQALGAAAALSVTAAAVRRLYPDAYMGRGLAFNSLIISVAAAAAPTLGGYLLTTLPWQSCFVAVAPLLCCSLLLGRNLPGDTQERASGFDALSALYCAATFTLLVGGLELAAQSDAYWVGAVAAVAGIGFGITLYRRERGAKRPILPLDLFLDQQFARAVAAAVAVFVATVIMNVTMPFRLTQLHDLSLIEVGQLLAVWPLTMMVVSPVAGVLSDRLAPGLMGICGTAAFVAAMIAMGLLPADASKTAIAACFVLGGIGTGLFLAPNSRLIVASAPVERAAAAGSSVSTARLVGQALGATAASTMLGIGLGNGPTPLFVAAGIAAIALVMNVLQLRNVTAAGDG